MATHYEVLGVAVEADHDEVRRAYHRAARRWHPDGFAGADRADADRAEAEMRRVNEAWGVLGDPARRRAYDRGTVESAAGRTGIRVDDGVTRIDPRLLDPAFLADRRHAQFDEISNRSALVLRLAPPVALVLLLAAIFVFTAYARGGGSAAPTTVAGPSLGAGIDADDCVTVLDGPQLMARPCDPNADGRVIGAREADGVCPVGTTREVELSSGVFACLAPPT